MARAHKLKSDAEKVADIIRDAGGKIVGRTRLQKIAYLLELAGLGDGFTFEYRHYGPYSEDLATAAHVASLLELVHEEERSAQWGGSYSIFTAEGASTSEARSEMVLLAKSADSIELELAATAAFFAASGHKTPWKETASRKPEKAQDNRLDNAKSLYRKLQKIETPKPLPKLS